MAYDYWNQSRLDIGGEVGCALLKTQIVPVYPSILYRYVYVNPDERLSLKLAEPSAYVEV